MESPLSVSNNFFSKMTHKFFRKFGMKFWCFKGKKVTEPDLLQKKSHFGEKSSEISPK